MQIFIKALTGKTIIVEVESYHTIQDIKNKVNEQEGIFPDDQKLTFEGKDLVDGFVSDYKLENESVLSLTSNKQAGEGENEANQEQEMGDLFG